MDELLTPRIYCMLSDETIIGKTHKYPSQLAQVCLNQRVPLVTRANPFAAIKNILVIQQKPATVTGPSVSVIPSRPGSASTSCDATAAAPKLFKLISAPTVRPKIPPAEPKIPPVQPKTPPVQLKIPPVQTRIPPVQPEISASIPKIPPAAIAMGKYTEASSEGSPICADKDRPNVCFKDMLAEFEASEAIDIMNPNAALPDNIFGESDDAVEGECGDTEEERTEEASTSYYRNEDISNIPDLPPDDLFD